MTIKIANYGQDRERIATESELEIFDRIKSLVTCPDLELVRRSDNYVTAVLGDWDVARFKYSPRAKWLMLPIVERNIKHKIGAPEDVDEYQELLLQTLEHIKKYS